MDEDEEMIKVEEVQNKFGITPEQKTSIENEKVKVKTLRFSDIDRKLKEIKKRRAKNKVASKSRKKNKRK